MTKAIAESKLDRMVQAYVNESERWYSCRAMDKSHYQIVRNSSPKNDINADEYFEVTDLPRGYDHDDAQEIVKMRQGRAAMHAALVAGGYL